MTERDFIINDIREERVRQTKKWGIQNQSHPYIWLGILMEEVGEASKEATDAYFNNSEHHEGTVEWTQWLNERLVAYRKEMVQVAAVSVQMLEDFDHNYPELTPRNHEQTKNSKGGSPEPEVGDRSILDKKNLKVGDRIHVSLDGVFDAEYILMSGPNDNPVLMASSWPSEAPTELGLSVLSNPLYSVSYRGSRYAQAVSDTPQKITIVKDEFVDWKFDPVNSRWICENAGPDGDMSFVIGWGDSGEHILQTGEFKHIGTFKLLENAKDVARMIIIG